jgi:Ferritin-like domain
VTRLWTRRGVLVASGGAVASGLAACTGGGAHPATSTSAPTPSVAPTTTTLAGDLTVATLAASLENSIVAAYTAAADLLNGGKLGVVPAAVALLVQTMQSHHRDHATAWNAMLTAAGGPPVTGIDATFSTAVAQPGIAALRDTAGLLALAQQLERAAAGTYLDAVLHRLTTTGATETAIAIHPVEMQHLAVLAMLAGSSPAPDAFATTAGARTTGDQTG